MHNQYLEVIEDVFVVVRAQHNVETNEVKPKRFLRSSVHEQGV